MQPAASTDYELATGGVPAISLEMWVLCEVRMPEAGSGGDISNSVISQGCENASAESLSPQLWQVTKSSLPLTAGMFRGLQGRESRLSPQGCVLLEGRPGAQATSTPCVSLLRSPDRHGFPVSGKAK